MYSQIYLGQWKHLLVTRKPTRVDILSLTMATTTGGSSAALGSCIPTQLAFVGHVGSNQCGRMSSVFWPLKNEISLPPESNLFEVRVTNKRHVCDVLCYSQYVALVRWLWHCLRRSFDVAFSGRCRWWWNTSWNCRVSRWQQRVQASLDKTYVRSGQQVAGTEDDNEVSEEDFYSRRNDLVDHFNYNFNRNEIIWLSTATV